MFSSLHVCLVFVCQLATLRGNLGIDLHGTFRIGRTWYKEQPGTFWGCYMKPLGYIFYSRETVSVNDITENG